MPVTQTIPLDSSPLAVLRTDHERTSLTVENKGLGLISLSRTNSDVVGPSVIHLATGAAVLTLTEPHLPLYLKAALGTSGLAEIITNTRLSIGGGLIQEDLNLNANDTNTVTPAMTLGSRSLVGFEIIGVSGTHNTHVFTLQVSPDNTTWYSTGTTLTNNGMVAGVTVAFPFARLKCSTAQGGASVVNSRMFAK